MSEQNSPATDLNDALAEHLMEKADGEYLDFRKPYTEKWMQIYYAYIGQFREGEAPKEDWQTKIYVKALKVKVLAAWSQFVQSVMSLSNLVNVEERDGNKGAAIAMRDTIIRQFEDADLTQKLKTGALDCFLYGPAFFQAPAVESQRTKEWVLDKRKMFLGQLMNPFFQVPPSFKMQISETQVPTIYNRNVFEMFPAPYSTSMTDGEGVFHRPFLSEHELAELRNKPGFDKKAIDDVIKAGAYSSSLDDGAETKAVARGYSGKRKGFDLMFYTGKVSGEVLRKTGRPEFENVYGYQDMWVWVLRGADGKGRTIKVVPNPLPGQERPFLSTSYERVGYEVMGVGIGENALDMHSAINGGMRLYFDAKKAALPQIAVNRAKWSPDGGKLKFSPWKVWSFNIDPKEAISFFKVEDVSDGIITMVELAERFMDEITGIPKFTTGMDNRMVNKTAAGLSMLMNAQGQLLRGAIENFDDSIIEPLGELFYDWNMQFNPDPNIKGNMVVKANGLATMMQKDSMNEQLLRLLSFVVNPTVTTNPYALKLLRMVGENIGVKDVDGTLPKAEDLERSAAMSPEAAMQQVGPMSAPPSVGGPGAPAAPGVMA